MPVLPRGVESVKGQAQGTLKAVVAESVAFVEENESFYVTSVGEGIVSRLQWGDETSTLVNRNVSWSSSGIIATQGKYLHFLAQGKQEAANYLNTSFPFDNYTLAGTHGKFITTDLDGTVLMSIELTHDHDLPGNRSHNLKYFSDLAADDDGNVYITESYGGGIYKVTKEGAVSVLAHSDYFVVNRSKGVDSIAIVDGHAVVSVVDKLFMVSLADGTVSMLDVTGPAVTRYTSIRKWEDGMLYITGNQHRVFKFEVDVAEGTATVKETAQFVAGGSGRPCTDMTAAVPTSYGVYALCSNPAQGTRANKYLYRLDFADMAPPAVVSSTPDIFQALAAFPEEIAVTFSEALWIDAAGFAITNGRHTAYVKEGSYSIVGRWLKVDTTGDQFEMLRKAFTMGETSLSIVFRPETARDFRGNWVEMVERYDGDYTGEVFLGAVARILPNMIDDDSVKTEEWVYLGKDRASEAVKGAEFSLQLSGLRYYSNRVRDGDVYLRLSKSKGCSAIPNPDHEEGFEMDDTGNVVMGAVQQLGEYHVCIRHREEDWQNTGHTVTVVEPAENTTLFFGATNCLGAISLKEEEADYCGCYYKRLQAGDEAPPAMIVDRGFPAWRMSAGAGSHTVVSGCCKYNAATQSTYELSDTEKWGLCTSASA